LTDQGDVEFRTGGTRGAAKLFFGELAELGEGVYRLRVLACMRCGQVALHYPTIYEEATERE